MSHYQSVLNLKNEEIGIRIFALLMDTERVRPKLTQCKDLSEVNRDLTPDKIGFLRFVNRIMRLKDPASAITLSFRFLDFDNSGALGSIDILNLQKCFDPEKLDEVQKLFYEERIKRDLRRQM